MTESEKTMLGKIKKWIGPSLSDRQYMFWFVYDNDTVVNWEGGWELPLDLHFRNQYTLHNGTVTKNWE